MNYLPEFIKYRVNCGFVLGVMLITPLATLILNLLTFDMKLYERYNYLVIIADVVLAGLGFWIVVQAHHYLVDKELKYAQFYRS